MRSITYAGETVITSDEVAESLIELTAAVAQRGHAEAVKIPIVRSDGVVDSAELVIGVGNDVLSAPIEWTGSEPDLVEAAAKLRKHPLYPQTQASLKVVDDPSDDANDPETYDIDLDQDRA